MIDIQKERTRTKTPCLVDLIDHNHSRLNYDMETDEKQSKQFRSFFS